MKIACVVGLLALSVTGGVVAQTTPPHLHHDDPFTRPRTLNRTACFAQRKAAGPVVIRLNDSEDSANIRSIIGMFDSAGTLSVLLVFLPTESYVATFDSLMGRSGSGLVLPPRVFGDSDYVSVPMSDTALVRARALGRWLWNSPCRTNIRYGPPASRDTRSTM